MERYLKGIIQETDLPPLSNGRPHPDLHLNVGWSLAEDSLRFKMSEYTVCVLQGCWFYTCDHPSWKFIVWQTYANSSMLKQLQPVLGSQPGHFTQS